MRALVIEDNPDIAEVLKKGLECECLIVETAEDGERGAFLAKTNEYDLIILDNVLPKKEGLFVCKDIRAHGTMTPILSLSVRGDTTTKINLLNAGADDYLTKPFCLDEVRARARALLRRPHGIQGDTLSIDDLTLSTREQKVERAGKRILLTKKEYMLLEYLMRNRDAVVSRAKILEHVWDMSVDPFSNTIEAHVMTLRRKIERTRTRKLIHTVPGSGYKIAAVP
ncbi:MAG: response regulator transcription factor [Patescibacteria group bacterium]